MKSLLSDANKLQGVYGLQSATQSNSSIGRSSNIVSKNSINLFTTSCRRLCARFAGDQARSTLASRAKWAIPDKARF
jgi:Prion-inhibition and propagation